MNFLEMSIGLALLGMVLAVGWAGFGAIGRQDVRTQRMADRLQTFASVQRTLALDVEAGGPELTGQVDPDGQRLVLDGPHGKVEWELRSGTLTRNGKPVGVRAVEAVRFGVQDDAGVSTVRANLTWREEGVSVVACSWAKES